MDAITIANLKLYALDKINISVTAKAIVIACVANLVVKLAIVLVFGDRQLFVPVLIGFGLVLTGVVSGLIYALSHV